MSGLLGCNPIKVRGQVKQWIIKGLNKSVMDEWLLVPCVLGMCESVLPVIIIDTQLFSVKPRSSYHYIYGTGCVYNMLHYLFDLCISYKTFIRVPNNLSLYNTSVSSV